MEASQALHRCVSNVLSRPSSRTVILRAVKRSHQPSKITPISTRTFVASTKRHQDSQTPTEVAARNSEIRNEQPAPASPMEQSSRGASEQPPPRQSSYSREGRRIDLSTLPGIGSDYRPPRRDPISAKAKLDSLLQQSSAPRVPPRSSIPRPLTDIYNAFEKPRSDPNNRFSASPAESNSLLAILDGAQSPLKSIAESAELAPMPLRLRPTLGRTQAVRPEAGLDLTRAFRSLEMKCNANNVKRDEIDQRFHVRRGQKKKLDRSKRWRILFRQGFLEECGRVRRMMRQGW